MIAATLDVIALDDEIARYRRHIGAAGRRAETLIKSDRLRVVLVTMEAGTTLNEHAAPGEVVIQGLRGRFKVHAGGAERELDAGELLAIGPRVRHDVQAVESGAFLLTMSWPSRLPGDPALGVS